MNKALLFICLMGLSVLSIAISLIFGASPIDLFSMTSIDSVIVWQIRFPRILAAFIVGACLATAGAAFQGVLRNPLADPYILGVSAGAGLGLVLSVFLNLHLQHVLFTPTFAFLGAVSTIFMIHYMLKFLRRPTLVHYILTGIVVNAFFSSIMMGFFYFSQDKLSGIMGWLLGDLSNAAPTLLLVTYGLAFLLYGGLVFLGQRINVLSLGDVDAKSLGVDVDRLRKWVFILASCLSGLAVANGGIIGFIGLVVPHFLRLLIGDNFRWLIALSFWAGGLLLVFCDTLSRSVFAPIELPVGLLTSLLGTPFFLMILFKKTRL